MCWENYKPTNYNLQSLMKKVTGRFMRTGGAVEPVSTARFIAD